MTDAGAAIGVVVSSLLARTGAVRIKSHASAAPQPVTAGVSQPRSSVKRRSVDGNGGGGGNGGGAEADSHYSLTESLLLQQQQPQQTFVLPFKAFCVGFSVATLVLVALAVGKQNIPALQNPLAPGAALHVPQRCTCALLGASLRLSVVMHCENRSRATTEWLCLQTRTMPLQAAPTYHREG